MARLPPGYTLSPKRRRGASGRNRPPALRPQERRHALAVELDAEARPVGNRERHPGDREVVGPQLHHNGVPPVDARDMDAGGGEFHRRGSTEQDEYARLLAKQPRQRKIMMAPGPEPISMHRS